jgi:hypothetical protein
VAYRFGTGEEAAFTRPYPKSGNHCSLLESAFLEREPRKHVCGQADNVPMWDSRAGTSVSASGLNTNTSGTLAILIGRLTIGVYPTPRPPGRGPQLVSRLPPGGKKSFLVSATAERPRRANPGSWRSGHTQVPRAHADVQRSPPPGSWLDGRNEDADHDPLLSSDRLSRLNSASARRGERSLMRTFIDLSVTGDQRVWLVRVAPRGYLDLRHCCNQPKVP